jgi:signal transduction histidine kinase
MIKPIFVFLILFSLKLSAQQLSQQQADSLAIAVESMKSDTAKCDAYARLSNYYLYISISKGLAYADKEINLGTELGWQKGIGTGHLNMGRHLISKGDLMKAMKQLSIAEEIFIRIADRYGLAAVNNQLGILKANQNRFPEALDHFFKAAKGFESSREKNAKTNAASAYQNIANIYTATESYDKALENYETAIRLFSALGNEDASIAMNIASKGLVYQKQNRHAEALRAYREAEKILISKNNDGSALVFVQSWIGSAYLSLKQYDLSLEYSNKALKTIQTMGDEILMASTLQNIGYAQLKKGMLPHSEAELETGKENILKSLEINKKLGNIEALINDYLYLSEYYAFKKLPENSLDAYKLYSMYKDSIYNSKNKQSLQNVQDERTIEMRDTEIEVNKLTLEAKERQKWLLMGGILLFVVIVILLIYQNRSRRKINDKLYTLNAELEEANRIKTRFFTILNHDLRSPVSNLIHFLHLKNESPELLTEQSKVQMENKVVSAAENLLISMEDLLLWSKGQMQNFKPVLKEVRIDRLFDDLRNHFLSSEIRMHFEDPGNLSLTSDADYLKTIMRNLTGNAVKALEKTSEPLIVWKAWREENKTYLSITDNGPGGSEQQFKALYDETEVVGIKTGLGLHLIRDLAKAIHCSISVESTPHKGTSMVLVLD